MSRRARTAGRVGAFLALAVLLTGCIKLNVDLGINADDTVNGAVVLGVQKELLELTGQSAEDLLGDPTDRADPADPIEAADGQTPTTPATRASSLTPNASRP